jgi:hypothetical protein
VRGRRRAARAVAFAGVLAIAGCAPTAPTTPGPTISSPSTSLSASVTPAASSPVASSSAAGAVAVDPALLDLLPPDIDGQPLRPDAETAGDIAATGDLAEDIEAIAVALYIQPGTSTADNIAIVSVVRLQPGVFDDGWFRSWRTTYDEGACQVAGGVAPGGAETRIGDHDTHIGTCEGGVHTYHVHLEDPDRVISISAAGEGRFGERVVAGLTE